MQTKNPRRTDLAKIHIARKALALSDADYQALIGKISQGRTSSAADLDVRERGMLLAHFRKHGWQPAHRRKRGQSYSYPVVAADAQSRKVRALWLLLHELALVRDPSERALGRYCKRVTGADALQWTDRLDKLIEGLKDWAMRALPQQCAALGGRLQAQLDAGQAVAPGALLVVAQAQQALCKSTHQRLFNEYAALYAALKAALLDAEVCSSAPAHPRQGDLQ